MVDAEEKRVAEGETSEADFLPAALKRRGRPTRLSYNKSALIQDHNAFIASQVSSSFSNSHRGKRMHKIDPSPPSAKFSLLVHHLPCRHASTIIQLHTGHAPLNHPLARIGKVPSPACPNCDATFETIHHFLFMCPVYEVPRQNLQVKVGPHKMDFKGLLAETNNTRHLLRFLEQTKRLAPTFRNLNPPKRCQ